MAPVARLKQEMLMPLNDHVLLLQLERAVEALHDEVELPVDSFADVDHTHDDQYAWSSEVDDLKEDLREAVDLITKLTEANAELESRVSDLEETVGNLVKTLNAALFGPDR